MLPSLERNSSTRRDIDKGATASARDSVWLRDEGFIHSRGKTAIELSALAWAAWTADRIQGGKLVNVPPKIYNRPATARQSGTRAHRRDLWCFLEVHHWFTAKLTKCRRI